MAQGKKKYWDYINMLALMNIVHHHVDVMPHILWGSVSLLAYFIPHCRFCSLILLYILTQPEKLLFYT
jgi:hypothetical protein